MNTQSPTVPAPPGAFPTATYDALLKKYVDDQGRVDYAALKEHDAGTVEMLYSSLAASGPDKTPALYAAPNAALAYYLDAYNLLVWKNVIDRLPKLRRVDQDDFGFFHAPQFQVDNKTVNLDDLEKKIIRPRFKDGRIHFALNCASGGCPRLPREAFTAAKVQQQLDREARRFVNEGRNVNYDPPRHRVQLSMIFQWYKEDFGKDDAAVLGFINRYRPRDAQIPADGSVQIDHRDYDWRLNDPALPARKG